MQLGNPTEFHLTPRQAHDLEGADVLLVESAADMVIADMGYDAQAHVVEPLLARIFHGSPSRRLVCHVDA